MPATLPHLAPLLDASFPKRAIDALLPMKGEVSTRRYYRLRFADAAEPRSLVVMRLPDDGAEGPSRVQARAFVDVQRWLAANALPVPRIYAHDIAGGVLLLEDLGDETFEARLLQRGAAAWPALYGQAIDLLAELHARAAATRDPDACIAFRKRYDAALLRSELDHYREWGLEALDGPLSAAGRSELDALFDRLTAAIVALPSGFVHRDYQSRNLMWRGEHLTILDFQDAFIGPAPYDLVALLCDSYVELGAELQRAMLARYAQARSYTQSEQAELERGYNLIALQRKLKDAGRFVYIERVRNNPDFLRYYPGSIRYVSRALEALPDFAGLRAFVREREASPKRT